MMTPMVNNEDWIEKRELLTAQRDILFKEFEAHPGMLRKGTRDKKTRRSNRRL